MTDAAITTPNVENPAPEPIPAAVVETPPTVAAIQILAPIYWCTNGDTISEGNPLPVVLV